MQIPKQYMSNWVGYWSYVADHVTQTWDHAIRDVERRKYSPTKMMSDLAGSWMVAATGWCLPAYIDGRPDVLLFVIPATAEAAPAKTVPVFAARCPKGDPEIVLIDGPGAGNDEKVIGKGQYFVQWSKRKDFVAVGLRDLAEPNAKPPVTVAKGTYRSLVRVGDEPIAFIYIEVS